MVSSYEKLTNSPIKVEIWNGQYSCPLCLKLFGNVKDISENYKKAHSRCPDCNQLLDWK